MREQTRLEHEDRLAQAVEYVADHLDDMIDLRDLADHVCLSRFYFHRLFRSLLGETVGEMARRLRLERAAQELRTTRAPILDVAIQAGYGTHEAFIKAFRAAFGYPPSDLRHRLKYSGDLPTPNGVHYGNSSQIRFLAPRGDRAVEIEIRECEPLRAVCMQHTGPYFMIGHTFSQLWAWLKENQVPLREAVALYYDDPESTPPAELKSDAGMTVPLDFHTLDPVIHVLDTRGGSYAVFVHKGPYEGITRSWQKVMAELPRLSGYSFGPGVPIEVYLNDCADTSPDDLRTELRVPVTRTLPGTDRCLPSVPGSL